MLIRFSVSLILSLFICNCELFNLSDYNCNQSLSPTVFPELIEINERRPYLLVRHFQGSTPKSEIFIDNAGPFSQMFVVTHKELTVFVLQNNDKLTFYKLSGSDISCNRLALRNFPTKHKIFVQKNVVICFDCNCLQKPCYFDWYKEFSCSKTIETAFNQSTFFELKESICGSTSDCEDLNTISKMTFEPGVLLMYYADTMLMLWKKNSELLITFKDKKCYKMQRHSVDNHNILGSRIYNLPMTKNLENTKAPPVILFEEIEERFKRRDMWNYENSIFGIFILTVTAFSVPLLFLEISSCLPKFVCFIFGYDWIGFEEIVDEQDHAY